jgi:excisionase family DNA binding protein
MILPERPLTPVEFAKALGCGRHAVDDAIHRGDIPAAKIGRRYFIPHRVAVEILTSGRIPQTADATTTPHREGISPIDA